MIDTILWRPQLGTLANTFVVLGLIAWLCFLYYRYRSLHGVKRSWFLLMPKILFTMLILTALLDPCWRVVRPKKDAQKVVILTDASTSMGVKDRDDGTRAERAQKIADEFENELGEWINFVPLEFDLDVRDPEKDAEESSDTVRGTDIGKTMVTLSQKPELADAMAVVMLTDGGDEVVDCELLPNVPIYIAGVGTEPSTWNDLAVSNVKMPSEVEANTPFKVSADLLAHASGDFSLKTVGVDVTLEKKVGDGFRAVDTQTLDLRNRQVSTSMEVPGEEKEGVYTYRLGVKEAEGEITTLNNERVFRVDVRKKKIYVLLYGCALNWDYALLKRALEEDPTIGLTSVYRKNDETFRIEGTRQEGDEVFNSGFPTDEEILNRYKCIVLGSFRSDHLREESFEALKKYVDGGGSIIFLGGADSFGNGEYHRTPAAPLIPWRISIADKDITAGQYPIAIPPEAASHGMMSATADLLEKVPSPVIYSVNHVGSLHDGAMSLMNASVGDTTSAVVALQTYGKGQTLGMATDTLWRWGRKDGNISKAYYQLWRDVIRHMSGESEGGRFLSVKWDRKKYNPSEEAVADIHVAGRYAVGEVRLKGTITHGDETKELTIDPIRDAANVFKTKLFFPDRGEYTFKLEAVLRGETLDEYQRTIRVGSAVNEGAELAVDRQFLEQLAARSRGYYRPENEASDLVASLRAMVMATAGPRDFPLVEKPDILNGGLPVFVLLAMLVLAAEWIIRRRLNMV